MIQKVLKYIRDNQILEYGDSVVLGVSGGADSICLLHVLYTLKEKLGLKLCVVHVNHHIRGESAEQDAEFVKNFCNKLSVNFVQVDVDVPAIAKEKGLSEEEAGRNARYDAFNEIADAYGANKIAVAHNLNDNSETILFNLVRGTGVKGLIGIPAKRKMIIRPLLSCTREEIEEYLIKEGLSYRTDETNLLTEYSRNKLRLDVIPYLKENINEKAEYNIVNAAQNLGEIFDFVNKEVKNAYDEYVTGNIFHKAGFEIHIALQREIFRKMIKKQAGQLKDITRKHINSITELASMEVSKQIDLPYGLAATRVYEGIRIAPKVFGEKRETEITLIKNGKITPDKNVEITMETEEFSLDNIQELVYTKWLDCDKIHSLVLRNRQKGDYLVIDSKGKRKKLKKYFIDEKIPKQERDNMLLLADGNHVVWIPGYRISAYYKVSEMTKNIIKITYLGGKR